MRIILAEPEGPNRAEQSISASATWGRGILNLQSALAPPLFGGGRYMQISESTGPAAGIGCRRRRHRESRVGLVAPVCFVQSQKERFA
jgi:hypothetical protein